MNLTKKQQKMLLRIVLAGVFTAALNFIPISNFYLKLGLYLGVYILIGYDILRKAGLGIVNGRPSDENFLMAVATAGAFALAIWEKSGDYNEAIAVMLFYQIGEFFQNYAVGKSRKSISALMDIRPDYANVETGGTLQWVDPNEVEVGSIIIVQPGEKVPLDGIVEKGNSTLNTSALTGESLPRDVGPGDEIISGCINLVGVLRVRTTKPFGESTVTKVLELVENSTSNKSQSEAFITRFARIYTPAVCFSALALAVLPPLFSLLLGSAGGPEWETWIYRALTFLVISCPCALVISIPLSFFAAIGGAGRRGILVKGSNYLEALSKVRTFVFDKTGTLTKGVFEVMAVHHSPIDEARIIELAAHAECASSHPISRSIQTAYGKPVDRSRVADIQEVAGEGVIAVVDGMKVAAGNEKLMRTVGVEPLPCHCTGTLVHIALDGEYAGHILISDVVKPTSRSAIDLLRKAGITRTVMLTGDSAKVAGHVAVELGVDRVCSGLLPADKVQKVEELMADGTAGKLAFVGDGINDAPVLTRADIGIAMGAMGSDAAIEAADVVLMDDDPMGIVTAVRISRKCLRIVRQNIVFALSIKAACLVLGALGLAGMWAAVFADVGVMVLAVLNSMRSMRIS